MILSIHDLTRRSTIDIAFENIKLAFQFTTSQGGRQNLAKLCGEMAPFNSRPHKEVDGRGIGVCVQHGPFNSRPHKEVDRRSTTAYFARNRKD